MKILVIGTDNTVLQTDSKLAKRSCEYAQLVERYDVVVPHSEHAHIRLAETCEVFGVGGKSKFDKLKKIRHLAEKLMQKYQYDVISVQDTYYLGWVACRLARKFGVGFELQIHGFEKFRLLRKFIAGRVIRRASSIRVVSLRLVKLLVQKYNIDPLRITQVPIYSDWQKVSSIDNGNGLRDRFGKKSFIFITIGRLVPVKRIELQLKALRRMKKKLSRRSVKLLIVGDGIERKKLERLSKKLKLTRSVFFLGTLDYDETMKYLRISDCMLLTSEKEGWGRVVVESLATGTPVVMTDVGCAGEIVVDNVNGLIVPVNDLEELTQAMLSLIQNDVQYQKLAKNSQIYLSKLPNYDETLKLYLHSWELAKKYR